jgi:hypothetical protein
MPIERERSFTSNSLVPKQPSQNADDFDDDDVLLPPNYKTMYPFQRKQEIEADDPLYQGVELNDTSLPHHAIAEPIYGSRTSPSNTDTNIPNAKRPWTPIRLALMIFNVLLLVYSLAATMLGLSNAFAKHSSGQVSLWDDPMQSVIYELWIVTIILLLPASFMGMLSFASARYKFRAYIAYVVLLSFVVLIHVAQLFMYIAFCFIRQRTESAPFITEIGLVFTVFFACASVVILALMLTVVDMRRGKKFEALVNEELLSEASTTV